MTRLKATGAQLIWANTTFVPPQEAGRKIGDDRRYNRVAEKIMRRHGIAITDLNAVTRGFASDLFVEVGNVHFTKAGYQVLAQVVEEGVEKALKRLKSKAP